MINRLRHFPLPLVTLIFLLISASLRAEQPAKIDKVEPPHWWTGMKSSDLQLMLYGDKIGHLQAVSPSKGWQIKQVHRTDNPNYLFVDIKIAPDAAAGDYQLELRAQGQVVESFQYSLKERQAVSSQRQGFTGADVIYLITPDRFINGDPKNDEIAGLVDGIDRSHEGGRRGGDIQGVINSLDYLASMGFTQIWLNPVLENKQDRYSYHGYSTTDYYRVDPRFGSNDLYRQLSAKAREKGIGLIKDVILNHIGSGHNWMQDTPSADWINHGKNFVSTSHRREALHDPHGTAEDVETFASGWFVPTMPDLNQRNPLLATYLIQNSIWWIESADLSGIRLDTYSYSDKNFLSDYTRRVMEEYPRFNLVGEEWSLNQAIIAYWQRGKARHDNYSSDMPSMMDFPLQDSLVKALTEKETWSDGLGKLYATLASDFVYAHPYDLTIFPDNHDMSRIHTQLGHDMALTKMAMAFFLTTRGIPQIFYGTEVLMSNPGTDSHGIIRTEFPGGWSDHSKSALTGKGLSNDEAAMQDYMKKLLNWRKQTPVIHYGKLTHYTPKDGVYVYFRHNEKDKVMVLMNKNDKEVLIEPSNYPSLITKNTKARDILSGQEYSSERAFKVAAKSVLIFQFDSP